MPDICTIRPRPKKDGYSVECGTLNLWYLSFEQALSYANDCLKETEIVIYDADGNITQSIPPRVVSNRLGDV